MVKKLRKLYIFLILALCLSLFACKGGGDGGSGDGGSQGSGNSQGGADTDSGTGDSGSADTAKNSYTIVYADGVPVTAVNKLVSQLEGELSADVSAMRYGSEVTPTENVIFVGECVFTTAWEPTLYLS